MSNIITDDDTGDLAAEEAEEQALQDIINGVEPEDNDAGDDNDDDNNDNSTIDDDDEDFNDDDNDDDNPDDDNDLDDDSNNDDSDDNDDNDKNEDDNDFETLSVEIDGTEIEVNSESELRAVVKKLTEDKPFSVNNEKRMLEQANLTKEDIALLADIKAGDKSAINELLKRQKVSLDDLDEVTDEYSQKFDYKEATELDSLAEQIVNDTEFLGTYNDHVSQLPQDFAEAVHSDPVAMKNFVKHVKSGLAGKIIPEAKKAAMLNSTSFMEEYAKIGRQLAGKAPAGKQAKKEVKREVKEKSRSRRAKRSQNRSGKPKEFSASEIANMTEDEFTEHFGE